MFTFPLRQHIWQEDGIWWLNTGFANIPHESWQLAWNHAAFVNHIRNDILA